jgi:Ulp1 family protease
VYPFVSDSKALDESSLAFDRALGFDTSCHSPTGNDKRVDTDSSDQQEQGTSTKETDGSLQDSTKTNGLGRTHYLSITREDYQRLEPGEFLNDTLIDFFMKWYEFVFASFPVPVQYICQVVLFPILIIFLDSISFHSYI